MITHSNESPELAIELQPTQPVEAQDEQPTQPLEPQCETPQEQPTQLLSRDEQLTEQSFSQPITIPRRTRSKLRWLVLLPFYLLLIGGTLEGRAAIESRLTTGKPAVTPHPQSTPVIIHSQHTSVHVSILDTTIQGFMHAMMRKDWATMWSMLSSDTQQLFKGEQDFERFEQAKFGAITFVSFQSSKTQLLQPWLDPDTTRVYSIAAVLQISLNATAPAGVLTVPSRNALLNGLFHDTSMSLVLRNGRWQVVLAGPADLDAPVLVPASPSHVSLLVPVFMYHHVSNKPTQNVLDYSLTVTTTDFNAQLDWLQAQGYHSINMTELFDALYYGKALPPHSMILSFDDGYADMYTDALPALLAHQYRGVFYIITGMIGGRYLTWNQVRGLANSGMQIASHTIHHVNIGQPPAYTTTQAELQQSQATLQALLGQPIQFFCYPTGEPFHHDSYYEQQVVLADLLKDGYVGATLDPFSFDSAIQNAQTPYQLPRVRVSGGESLLSFTGILNYVLRYDASVMASTNA